MNGDDLDAARGLLLQRLEQRLEILGEDEIGRLVRRLLGLPDRAIRRHRVMALLLDGCDALGYLLIRWLWHASAEHDVRARAVLLDLTTSRPFVEALGYDKARRLYGRARAAGEDDIAKLFLTAPVQHGVYGGGPNIDENEKLAYTSLGRRKALARGQDRMALDRLLFDRHPLVMRILLRNPRVVERDAVKIAAMRPNSPAVIQEVYRSSRWITRYSVKKAIAFNPYSPVDIAVGLLPHLPHQDLREIVRSGVVDPQVKQAALRLIEASDQRWQEARRRQDEGEEELADS